MDMKKEVPMGTKVKIVNECPHIKGWTRFLEERVGNGIEYIVAESKEFPDQDGWWVHIREVGWWFPNEAIELAEEVVIAVEEKPVDVKHVIYKYQPGDRVKFIKDRFEGQAAGPIGGKLGEMLTIKERTPNNYNAPAYFVNEYEWVYDERCLRRYAKAKVAHANPIEVKKDTPKAVPKDIREEVKKVDVKPSDTIPKLLLNITKEVNLKGVGTCSYAKKYADGRVATHLRDVCHARLPSPSESVVEVALNISGHVKELKEDAVGIEHYKQHVNYILNISPWKNCFKVRSLEQALQYGVMMDVSRPTNELMGAAVALREGSEKYGHNKMFSFLLDKGYSGHTAYVISRGVDFVGEENCRYTGVSNGHKALDGDMCVEGLVKFFKEGYYLTKELKPYSEDGRYHNWMIAGYIAKSDGKGITINRFIEKFIPRPSDRVWGEVAKPISLQNLYDLANAFENLLYK